jgi:hypothetical protein
MSVQNGEVMKLRDGREPSATWPKRPKESVRILVSVDGVDGPPDVLEAELPYGPIRVRSAGAERARRWREANLTSREILDEVMGR